MLKGRQLTHYWITQESQVQFKTDFQTEHLKSLSDSLKGKSGRFRSKLIG